MVTTFRKHSIIMTALGNEADRHISHVVHIQATHTHKTVPINRIVHNAYGRKMMATNTYILSAEYMAAVLVHNAVQWQLARTDTCTFSGTNLYHSIFLNILSRICICSLTVCGEACTYRADTCGFGRGPADIQV